MKRVSIKDIAQQVGVSYATVSLVLSGKDERISKATSEKIKKAAQELGYQPNLLAQSLQRGSSKAIGIVVADISNQFFATFVLHAQKELERAGYATLVVNTNEDPTQLDKMMRFLQNRQVDGYIVAPTSGRLDIIEELYRSNMPMVMFDREYDAIGLPSIVADNRAAMEQGAELLYSDGARRALLINFDHQQSNFMEREEGFCSRFTSLGAEVKSHYIGLESIASDLEQLFSNPKAMIDRFDAIVFISNRIAINSLKIIAREIYKNPSKIKILTFDQSDLYSMLPLNISYIQQPIEQMGKEASTMLISIIEGEFNRDVKLIKLPCNTISRCSEAIR